ncbi:MAG: hypothetical protein EBU10_06900 [Alphaproteobacteria bacterium]|jgi:hypothetical protein|nr:hypothetical protein [Alphaproteobacteria bacterium]
MESNMITLSRTRPSRYTGCQRCRVIRLFMLTVFMVVLLGLLANDKMEYLQFITAERAAMAIWGVGIIGFIVKFIFWRLDQRRAASDPEQA